MINQIKQNEKKERKKQTQQGYINNIGFQSDWCISTIYYVHFWLWYTILSVC